MENGRFKKHLKWILPVVLILIVGSFLFFKFYKFKVADVVEHAQFKEFFIKSCVEQSLKEAEDQVEEDDAELKSQLDSICLCMYDKIKTNEQIMKLKFTLQPKDSEEVLNKVKEFFETEDGVREVESCVNFYSEVEE